MEDANPVNGVIGEAFEAYKRHWQHFALLALIVFAITSVATWLLTALLSWLGAILAVGLSIVATFWLQGAFIKAVEDIRDGRVDLSVGDTFRAVQPYVGRIVGAGLIAGIAIAVGLLLLVVPGLFLLTIWSVVVPAIVLEDQQTFAAFGRSRELVRGHGKHVFVVILLTILIMFAFGLMLGILLTPLSEGTTQFLGDLISGVVIGPFVALTWTLMYYRLRQAEAGSVRTVDPSPPPPPPPGGF